MSTIKFQIQDTLTVLCKNVEKGHKVLLNVRKYDELISQLREAYQGDLKEVREDKSMIGLSLNLSNYKAKCFYCKCQQSTLISVV